MAFKAFPIGTAGFGAVDIHDTCYGVCSDAGKNANKFYTAEVQQDKTSGLCLVFVEYGRIGGTTAKKEYLDGGKASDLATTRSEYQKLLKKKFRNPKCSGCGNKSNLAGTVICSECDRHFDFRDYTYKYVPIELAQASTGSTEAQAIVDTDKLSTTVQAQLTVTQATTPKKVVEPLCASVSSLLSHFYEEAGHATRSRLNTGTLKATADNPLGTLSVGQITSGRSIVDDIRKLVVGGNADFGELMKLTSGYYNAIPQAVNVGTGAYAREAWKKLCIDDMVKLNDAIDLLDLLSDVKGVQSTFSASSTDWDRYNAVGANIELLDPNSPMYKEIQRRVTSQISRHHNHRYGKTKVQRIFKVRVKGQEGDFFDPNDVGNHSLMWHGSRNANMLGISSKGLLMRPPGAIVTGSMFGNGLYFAPSEGANACSSKSMQYAAGGWGGTRNQRKNMYLFHVNIAQGKVKELSRSNSSLVRAPKGFDSVRGITGQSLLHDEHMIYDLRQHRIEYIIDILPG